MAQNKKLAETLNQALTTAGWSVEGLAARTKVPRGTVRVLLGQEVNTVPLPRVYMRGHCRLVALELGLELGAVLASFDEEFPEAVEKSSDPEMPHFNPGALAVAAGLTGLGVLAIIFAFVG